MTTEERLALLPSEMVDTDIFVSILDLDEDQDSSFSREIVFEFFEQAEGTFEKMDTALAEKDFMQLSQLGHFLKGSSAALGLRQVRDSCEVIQNLGLKKNENGDYKESDDSKTLRKLSEHIKQTRAYYEEVKKVLKQFYNDDGE